ncbi:hypothetical protein NDU88_002301 [Pleurodeles waltl]|uniref:Uncharacterized protein n=1 Tax=Pleurodeles waltl TaxID=8319 RepID=A0AAV7KRR3_PLEWA|nr:hypothetical protein NDU88_002301 [Pleurodeles waltl]
MWYGPDLVIQSAVGRRTDRCSRWSGGVELAGRQPRCLIGGPLHRGPNQGLCGLRGEVPHGCRSGKVGPAVTAGGRYDRGAPCIISAAGPGWDCGDQHSPGLRGGEALVECDVERRISCGGLSVLIPPRVTSASVKNVEAITGAAKAQGREGRCSCLSSPCFLPH